MADQAQGLRALAEQTRRGLELDHSVLVSPRKAARTIAVTSGKGGVGKTHICANLGLLLAKRGTRVIILDADLGLANLHVVLGVSPPYDLTHVLRGEKAIHDILYPTVWGAQIISGGSGMVELATLDDEQRERCVRNLADLDQLADVILIDTGAGLSHNVLGFVLAAEEVIVVTTPEPTALADAYATIKVVSRENPGACLRLLVNMATSAAEAALATERLRLVAKQFLHLDVDVLGHLPLDAAIPRAVRLQQPALIGTPNSPMMRALAQMADTLGYSSAPGTGMGGFLNRMTRYAGKELHASAVHR